MEIRQVGVDEKVMQDKKQRREEDHTSYLSFFYTGKIY